KKREISLGLVKTIIFWNGRVIKVHVFELSNQQARHAKLFAATPVLAIGME
ncbi:hypothetical protein ACJX0J_034176, partial [Zea mays]